MRESVDQNNSEYGHFLRSGHKHEVTSTKLRIMLEFHNILFTKQVWKKIYVACDACSNTILKCTPCFIKIHLIRILTYIFDEIQEQSKLNHCVKIVHIRSYSGLHFPAFGLNADQDNSE